MIYQLKNGRCVNLTIEQYLYMTDADIEYMVSINYGSYIHNPFTGSAIRKEKRVKKSDIDKSIDYSEDSEELQVSRQMLSIIIVETVKEIIDRPDDTIDDVDIDEIDDDELLEDYIEDEL